MYWRLNEAFSHLIGCIISDDPTYSPTEFPLNSNLSICAAMRPDGRLDPSAGQDHGNATAMSMIVVVGVTGSGKSYLINRLAGEDVVQEGDTLDPCTQECQMIPVEIGNSKLLLIDTPGFDDTERTDADILNEIARVLAAQYALGFELKGIIYVHRITDIKYTGSNVKTFEIFKRICGEEALNNVLLITIAGDLLGIHARSRSCMSRFHGDRSSAVSLASQLLVKNSVILRLQHEMIDEGKDLNETTAGSFLDNNLERKRNQYLKEIEALEKLRKELRESDRAMKLQWEADWARERKKLRETEEQKVSLRRDVAGDVQNEIRQETKKKSRGLSRLIPLIPMSLNLLGMFVGLPPGSFELLSAFLMGDSSG
ncbi:hypothetical protein NM208_g1480 [Fusarium decemcellulare]|uniref:Uncharacterized protein n=1 Tax=Fusarium decemcellulare TaxID=57161 RepID=A0ACC1SVW8_9HYPO|nr:hypothetical protein NM208_g1480 [Fusarium decemcellulare]